MVHPSTPTPITIIPNKKPDHEGKMAKRQVFGIANDAAQIEAMLADDQQLDGWIQSKLTKAADYVSAVKRYLEYDYATDPVAVPPDEIPLPPMQESRAENEVPLETYLDLEKQVLAFRDALGGGGITRSYSNNFLEFLQNRIEHITLRDAGLKEAAKSKNQQQLMGAALRCKRTGDCSNEQVKKLANSMSEKELEDFASTSHKGLPDKVQENTLADNAKEQASDKKGDVRDVAKFMFKDQRLGPALAKLKDDKREAAQLISIIGGQLGLTPDDLVQIAKMASREG